MSTLNQDQARAIAEDFFEVSKGVGDFRFAHFGDLSSDQQAALQSLQQQLSNQSIHFTAVAIQLAIDDLQPTLAQIGSVTQDVNDAVTHLDDVRRIISIATTFVSLGAAIASGSPGTIVSAVGDVSTALGA